MTPRLRMFAGPNGSGKTTVKRALNKPAAWFGLYINPDDLEVEVRRLGFLDISLFGLNASTDQVIDHFAASELLRSRNRNANGYSSKTGGSISPQ